MVLIEYLIRTGIYLFDLTTCLIPVSNFETKTVWQTFLFNAAEQTLEKRKYPERKFEISENSLKLMQKKFKKVKDKNYQNILEKLKKRLLIWLRN